MCLNIVFYNMVRYVISDHHFDHENIIEYCNRDFKNTEEMNNYMRKKWVNTVSKEDVVIHGGDIAMSTRKRIIDIVNSLPGNILYILGNHDDDLSSMTTPFPIVENVTIQRKGYRFLYTHNPDNVPDNWTEWILHGHVHNNKPFINYDKKMINVSVENINYKPISIDKITNILSNCNNGDIIQNIGDINY